ncbi:MAG: response regulator [Phycisphaera sp.]|nr:response regulator [Phycisphaera sp.]
MRDKPLILVVDDESHILHVVTLKLTNAGYEVITAEDGEEGFAVAIESKPDLIITDYQMPYATGLELCQRLKGHEATRATPALMLTARGFSLDQDLLDQTNIADVISKPFSPSGILDKVHELLGTTKTGAENA